MTANPSVLGSSTHLSELWANTVKKLKVEHDTISPVSSPWETRCSTAEHYPEATTHIPEMLRMIDILFKRGYAYKSEDGSVYYSIDKFADYGKLARIDREQQRAGVRINSDEYEKDSVADFALWKAWDEADGDLGTPLGLAQRKTASPRGEAGTSGFLSVSVNGWSYW